MNSDESNKPKKLNEDTSDNSTDKPKFVKPTIKVTVIEINHDIYSHDTT